MPAARDRDSIWQAILVAANGQVAGGWALQAVSKSLTMKAQMKACSSIRTTLLAIRKGGALSTKREGLD